MPAAARRRSGSDPCTTRDEQQTAEKGAKSCRSEATLEGTADFGAKRDQAASSADDDSEDPSSKAREGSMNSHRGNLVRRRSRNAQRRTAPASGRRRNCKLIILSRLAIVYVRQSTPRVRIIKSQRHAGTQLVNLAVEMGWPALEAVSEVIDEDQGHSGAATAQDGMASIGCLPSWARPCRDHSRH